jgi:GTPase-activating protein SST2
MAVQTTTLDQLPSSHTSADFRPLSVLSTTRGQSPSPRSSISSSRPAGEHLIASPPLPASAPRLVSPPAAASGHYKPQRSSSALLSFAAAALDKTQSAFHNISDPVVRPRQSNSALARLSLGTGSLSGSEPGSPVKASSSASSITAASKGKSRTPPGSTLAVTDPLALDPPSQRYSETDPNTLPPVKLPTPDSKMHQTSSRLLRMTDDDRPFTKVSST